MYLRCSYNRCMCVLNAFKLEQTIHEMKKNIIPNSKVIGKEKSEQIFFV